MCKACTSIRPLPQLEPGSSRAVLLWHRPCRYNAARSWLDTSIKNLPCMGRITIRMSVASAEEVALAGEASGESLRRPLDTVSEPPARRPHQQPLSLRDSPELPVSAGETPGFSPTLIALGLISRTDTTAEAFANYEVGPVAGIGRWSEVRHVKHRPSGLSCVIKALPPHKPCGVLEEALMLITLRHPNIPALVDAWQGDTCFYLVMPYGGLPTTMTVFAGAVLRSCVRQLLLALAHSHSRRILHMDVQPDNILWESARGRLVLVDWGDAMVDSPTYHRTPPLADPEAMVCDLCVSEAGSESNLAAAFCSAAAREGGIGFGPERCGTGSG